MQRSDHIMCKVSGTCYIIAGTNNAQNQGEEDQCIHEGVSNMCCSRVLLTHPDMLSKDKNISTTLADPYSHMTLHASQVL